MDTIIFVTQNSNNFYKLELYKTLIQFVEYDFTYFWEQSIALGKPQERQENMNTNSFP